MCLRAILQETIREVSLKVTYLKFHLSLPGANELIYTDRCLSLILYCPTACNISWTGLFGRAIDLSWSMNIIDYVLPVVIS